MTDAGRPLAVSLDTSAVPPRPAGAGRYVVELARALARRDDVDLTLVAGRGDEARWRATAGVGTPVLGVVPRARPLRLLWERARMPRVVAGSGAVLHHSPHYTMPGWGSAHGVPAVVTVHDCTFFDHPEWHERTKVPVFRAAIRRAAAQAAGIVCVSATTARRLEELCAPRAPVTVIPHGVDHQRFRPDEPSPGADRAALAELGVDPERPMVLFVGTLEPRKGVTTLLEAFDRVAEAQPDLTLVLAGQPGWGDLQLDRRVAALRHGPRVRRTGYVPDAAVPALLRRAAVVAYPSLEEGFGLPAAEALACGAPLVTSAGTAMEELADGAAVVVAAGNAGQLGDALTAVLEEGPASVARTTRRARGLEVAGRLTWERSADRHVEAYRRALG